MENSVVLIGLSGHAYVVIDIFNSMRKIVSGYCEDKEKTQEIIELRYFGSERTQEVLAEIAKFECFIAIGDNIIRRKIYENTMSYLKFINAIHSTAYVSSNSKIGLGVMVGAKAVINPFAKLGNCVICNTASVIEHECNIGNFAHIAPNVTLCGNVTVGENSFVGAGSVVKQGITIGKNVLIGAGSVIIKDVLDNTIVVGNPQRLL